jgi:hypothetical protein
MTMLPARTVSVSVDRRPDAVYAYISNPWNLPHWAPGFATSVRQEPTGWVVETTTGRVGVAFVPSNRLGVVDHRVTDDQGLDVLNPMRVIGNGEGSEVLFTLFHPAGETDDDFQRDLGLVQSDLLTLKRLLEDER